MLIAGRLILDEIEPVVIVSTSSNFIVLELQPIGTAKAVMAVALQK